MSTKQPPKFIRVNGQVYRLADITPDLMNKIDLNRTQSFSFKQQDSTKELEDWVVKMVLYMVKYHFSKQGVRIKHLVHKVAEDKTSVNVKITYLTDGDQETATKVWQDSLHHLLENSGLKIFDIR
jgi:hypothetical protein